MESGLEGHGDGPRITKGDPRSAHGGGTGRRPRSVWPAGPLEQWFSTLSHRTATGERSTLRAASTPQTGCSGRRCGLYTEPIHGAPTSFRRKSAPRSTVQDSSGNEGGKGTSQKAKNTFYGRRGWHGIYLLNQGRLQFRAGFGKRFLQKARW